MNFNEKLKAAIEEAARWERDLSEFEKSEISHSEAKKIALDRIFEKYKAIGKAQEVILLAHEGFIGSQRFLDLVKEHGPDLVVISPEELLKKGINTEMFTNPPVFPIKALPKFDEPTIADLQKITAPIDAIRKKGRNGRKRW